MNEVVQLHVILYKQEKSIEDIYTALYSLFYLRNVHSVARTLDRYGSFGQWFRSTGAASYWSGIPWWLSRRGGSKV